MSQDTPSSEGEVLADIATADGSLMSLMGGGSSGTSEAAADFGAAVPWDGDDDSLGSDEVQTSRVRTARSTTSTASSVFHRSDGEGGVRSLSQSNSSSVSEVGVDPTIEAALHQSLEESLSRLVPSLADEPPFADANRAVAGERGQAQQQHTHSDRAKESVRERSDSGGSSRSFDEEVWGEYRDPDRSQYSLSQHADVSNGSYASVFRSSRGSYASHEDFSAPNNTNNGNTLGANTSGGGRVSVVSELSQSSRLSREELMRSLSKPADPGGFARDVSEPPLAITATRVYSMPSYDVVHSARERVGGAVGGGGGGGGAEGGVTILAVVPAESLSRGKGVGGSGVSGGSGGLGGTSTAVQDFSFDTFINRAGGGVGGRGAQSNFRAGALKRAQAARDKRRSLTASPAVLSRLGGSSGGGGVVPAAIPPPNIAWPQYAASDAEPNSPAQRTSTSTTPLQQPQQQHQQACQPTHGRPYRLAEEDVEGWGDVHSGSNTGRGAAAVAAELRQQHVGAAAVMEELRVQHAAAAVIQRWWLEKLLRERSAEQQVYSRSRGGDDGGLHQRQRQHQHQQQRERVRVSPYNDRHQDAQHHHQQQHHQRQRQLQQQQQRPHRHTAPIERLSALVLGWKVRTVYTSPTVVELRGMVRDLNDLAASQTHKRVHADAVDGANPAAFVASSLEARARSQAANYRRRIYSVFHKPHLLAVAFVEALCARRGRERGESHRVSGGRGGVSGGDRGGGRYQQREERGDRSARSSDRSRSYPRPNQLSYTDNGINNNNDNYFNNNSGEYDVSVGVSGASSGRGVDERSIQIYEHEHAYTDAALATLRDSGGIPLGSTGDVPVVVRSVSAARAAVYPSEQRRSHEPRDAVDPRHGAGSYESRERSYPNNHRDTSYRESGREVHRSWSADITQRERALSSKMDDLRVTLGRSVSVGGRDYGGDGNDSHHGGTYGGVPSDVRTPPRVYDDPRDITVDVYNGHEQHQHGRGDRHSSNSPRGYADERSHHQPPPATNNASSPALALQHGWTPGRGGSRRAVTVAWTGVHSPALSPIQPGYDSPAGGRFVGDAATTRRGSATRTGPRSSTPYNSQYGRRVRSSPGGGERYVERGGRRGLTVDELGDRVGRGSRHRAREVDRDGGGGGGYRADAYYNSNRAWGEDGRGRDVPRGGERGSAGRESAYGGSYTDSYMRQRERPATDEPGTVVDGEVGRAPSPPDLSGSFQNSSNRRASGRPAGGSWGTSGRGRGGGGRGSGGGADRYDSYSGGELSMSLGPHSELAAAREAQLGPPATVGISHPSPLPPQPARQPREPPAGTRRAERRRGNEQQQHQHQGKQQQALEGEARQSGTRGDDGGVSVVAQTSQPEQQQQQPHGELPRQSAPPSTATTTQPTRNGSDREHTAIPTAGGEADESVSEAKERERGREEATLAERIDAVHAGSAALLERVKRDLDPALVFRFNSARSDIPQLTPHSNLFQGV